ncbi:MAG: hypothetical protein KAX93_03110 [Flavobacterium sp.]|nr:hypothetical protein [Flavobacterium sp.]
MKIKQFENLKIYQEAFSSLFSPDCNGNNFEKVIAVKAGKRKPRMPEPFAPS